MTDLRVNTDIVIAAAKAIRADNKKMRDGASSVKNAILKLNASWDGAASNNAISEYNKISSKFYNARYNVLENYVNYLLKQVGEGYENTEETNKSLAEAFK